MNFYVHHFITKKNQGKKKKQSFIKAQVAIIVDNN